MITDRELTAADWHRLNRLLQDALELEPPDRTEWLSTLPDDSVDLKPLLEQLLAGAGAADLEGTSETLQPVVQLAAAAMAAMRREQAGDRIGPWVLERLLAEGGMGAVWVAQRADGVMKRTAALKLPRAEWVDHGLAARLARERAILARLQHPHIAVLYDAGLGAEGRPYLALEYVDGASIDAWCKGRDVETILRLFVQVVRAVAYAHGQLVIHRDLKPANVLVTAEGLPKLLDFGISKLIEGDAPGAEMTALTRLAGRPMTLAYAAPEQVLGLPITVAADVYALGVMLFELVTGSRLYRATEPRELEAELLRGDLRTPSETAADKARSKALRGDLDAVIGKALKRDSRERYESAAALADDLERYLDGQPVQAQPDSRAYRLRKFVARNTLPVAAGSAILIALGVGLGVALWQANVARDQAARATAMNTFVLSLIQQADPNASQQTKDADLAMLAAIEQRIDAEFKGSPDQLLQLRLTVGDAYRNRGEMVAARRVFQRAVDEAARVLPADDLQLLTARVRAADHRLIVSTAASAQLGRAIEILRTEADQNPAAAELLIDALLIQHELVTSYGVPAYEVAEANVKRLHEAEQVAIRSFGDGSVQHLKVATPFAELIAMRKGAEEARQSLEPVVVQAQRRGDEVTGKAPFIEATAVLAAFKCGSGEVVDGLDTLWNTIAMVRSAHGSASFLYESMLTPLAECLDAADDATASGLMAEAYEIASARERPPSTNLLRRAQGAFDSAVGSRDVKGSERYYQAALENAEAIPEDALRERLMMDLKLGRVCQLAQRGDAEEAERVAAPIIATFNAEYAQIGRLTPNQGGIWLCLSDAQRQQGRYDDAARTAHTFLERCRAIKRFVSKSNCEGRALAARALAELDAGHAAAAQATIEERLQLSREFDGDARFAIAYGRVMIANGRAAEALEVLKQNYGGWLSNQPKSPYGAEALYWFGQAYVAAGDPRGRWMVAQARQQLAASPVKTHQRLAARSMP